MSTASTSRLIVAAWDPELERFRTLLRAAPSLSGVTTHAIGIGLVDATLGIGQTITRCAPAEVVFIGTCGALPGSGLSIGDVIVASSARLVDPAAIEGRAALPFSPSEMALDSALVEEAVAAGARPATVVNPLGITIDDELARKLSAFGEVEHLEAYAVARSCQVVSIRCAVVLGVANVVGRNGREEWRANHVVASERAGNVAFAALRTSTTARSQA